MSCRDDIMDILEKKGTISKIELIKRLINKYSIATINYYIRELILREKIERGKIGRNVIYKWR